MATKKIISIITCLIFSMASALAEEWNFDAIMITWYLITQPLTG